MKEAKIFERMQEIFYAALDAKTGWGRNQIKEQYQIAMNQAILEYLEV